jgi:hypothetical protein
MDGQGLAHDIESGEKTFSGFFKPALVLLALHKPRKFAFETILFEDELAHTEILSNASLCITRNTCLRRGNLPRLRQVTQSHLIQALKRLKEIVGDGVALKLLLKRVLNYLYPFGQPHARFLVGLESAMHVVNFDTDVKGGLDEIHGKSNLWTRLTRCEKDFGQLFEAFAATG